MFIIWPWAEWPFILIILSKPLHFSGLVSPRILLLDHVHVWCHRVRHSTTGQWRAQKKQTNRYINTNSQTGYRMKYLSLQRHTSSCRDPCPVSQLALSSSLPTPSTSAPPFSSAAQDLCRSVAGMERWGGGVLENDKNRNTEKYWIQQEVEKHQITSKRKI